MTRLDATDDPFANAKGVAWAVLAVGLFAFMYVSGKFTGNLAAASALLIRAPFAPAAGAGAACEVLRLPD